MSDAAKLVDLSITSRRVLIVIIGAVGALVASVLIYRGIGMPLIQSDTESYLAWAPDRTPGYPLFLSILGSFSPSFAAMPAIQYFLLIAAVVFFADASAMLLRSFWAGLGIGIAIVCNVPLMRHPTGMMADSLFISLALIHVALIFTGLRSERNIWVTASGLALGAAILVRPVGYAFLLALPWLMVIWEKQRLRRGMIFLIAVLAPILVASGTNYVTRGYFGIQTLGQKNLLLSMEILMPPEISGFDRAMTRRAYDALAPLRNGAQGALAGYLTVPFWQPGMDVAIETINQTNAASSRDYDAELDNVCGKLAKAIILNDPLGFAFKVSREFYNGWLLLTITTQTQFDRVIRGFSTFGELHLDEMRTYVKIVPVWAYVLKNIALSVIALLSFGFLGAMIFLPHNPLIRALSYISALINSYLLLIAIAGSAVPRYVLAIWPLQCVLVAGTVIMIVRSHPALRATVATGRLNRPSI